MTDKELFYLYKIGKDKEKSYILDKGIKEIILFHYCKNFNSLPISLFPNIGYKGLIQIQNRYKREILISDNEQYLNENFNDYQKIINLPYLSFDNLLSIGRKKDIDFLKNEKFDASKTELLIYHMDDLEYLKKMEKK
jgi:hypothetical protein